MGDGRIMRAYSSLVQTASKSILLLLFLLLYLPTRWRMKSMCCFTARNMTPVDRNILISYWVIY